MMIKLISILVIPGLFAGSLIAETPATSTAEMTHSLRLKRSVLPIFPPGLRQEGISSGTATVIFSVDAEGLLSDTLPYAYTHRDFYTACLQAMRQWVFEPARSQGRTHPVVQLVTFNFEAANDVVEMTAADATIAFMNTPRIPGEQYRISRAAELDAVPSPSSVVSPGYPESLVGSGLAGDVTVEFIIDEEGRVRLPVIIDHTHPDFGAAAVEAVTHWRFEPPLRAGRPVATLVRQRFHFKPPGQAG